MDKLKIFSKKLGKEMNFSFSPTGKLVTTDGQELNRSGICFAWNNSYDSWVDQGWNNSSDSWLDKGWNNSCDSWTDKGWTNSSSRWSDQGWSNSPSSWGDSGSSGGGCYITTACVTFKGLPDDCHEMEVLRQYRDKLVREDEGFREKVLEYYRKAPLIVQKIEASTDKDDVLEQLFQNMVVACVTLLDNGDIEEAKSLYLENYEMLVKRYLES